MAIISKRMLVSSSKLMYNKSTKFELDPFNRVVFQVYFGTSLGQIVVMDVHGAMVAQVDLSSPLAITNMAWSCEKFKMEEGEDTTGERTAAWLVL